MAPMRMLIMLAVVGVTGSVLFAAEPAPSKPQATPAPAAQQQPQPTPTTSTQAPQPAPAADAHKKSAATDDEEKAPPPSTADKGPSPQRFTPSEEVRADFDVSFPIDI